MARSLFHPFRKKGWAARSMTAFAARRRHEPDQACPAVADSDNGSMPIDRNARSHFRLFDPLKTNSSEASQVSQPFAGSRFVKAALDPIPRSPTQAATSPDHRPANSCKTSSVAVMPKSS